MRKQLLLVLVFLSGTPFLFAQKSFELGFSGGITNYFGDLGNEAWFQAASTQPGATVTIRNFLGGSKYTGNLYRPISLEVRLSWNRLQYDETEPIDGRDGYELRNYGRGISFRNDLFGLATLVTYTIYSNPKMPLYNQQAALFLFTGAGVYYGQPKADLFRGDIDMNNKYFYWPDGTVRDAEYEGTGSAGNIIQKDGDYETNLSEWYTEGGIKNGEGEKVSPYSLWHVGIPFGLGVRYGISKKITLSTEFGYYYFFTDFLDDVSDAYPTYDEINRNFPNDPIKQELALYISDPTGKGTTGYPGPATSPRGNPGKNDGFSYVSLELAYKFELRKGVPKLWGFR